MSRIKFIYCKPCILSPLEDFRASNKGQRQTYKSVSRFLCALHKGHRQIPQTRDTALLPCRCACSGQSCPILFDSTGCSPPSSSVHGILQARIPEWIAIPFSRGSSRPRDWIQVSCIAGSFFTIWATGKSSRRVWHELKQLLGIRELSKINGRGRSACVTSKKQYRNSSDTAA